MAQVGNINQKLFSLAVHYLSCQCTTYAYLSIFLVNCASLSAVPTGNSAVILHRINGVVVTWVVAIRAESSTRRGFDSLLMHLLLFSCDGLYYVNKSSGLPLSSLYLHHGFYKERPFLNTRFEFTSKQLAYFSSVSFLLTHAQHLVYSDIRNRRRVASRWLMQSC